GAPCEDTARPPPQAPNRPATKRARPRDFNLVLRIAVRSSGSVPDGDVGSELVAVVLVVRLAFGAHAIEEAVGRADRDPIARLVLGSEREGDDLVHAVVREAERVEGEGQARA